MKIIQQWSIRDNYSLAESDSFPKDVYKKLLNDHLLDEYPFLKWEQKLTKDEMKR